MVTIDYLNIFLMIAIAGLLVLFINNNSMLGGGS